MPPSYRRPGFFDGLLFVSLLSGPPKFRARDITASLRGEIDLAVVFQVAVWSCGLLWILYRLFPLAIRHKVIPRMGTLTALGAAFLLTLSFSLARSPSISLSGFVIGQAGVMLLFAWVFAERYGPELFVHWLFWGYVVLCVMVCAAWLLEPSLVVVGLNGRLRGDLIAPTGAVTSLALGLGLSGAIRLRRALLFPLLGLFFVLLLASQTRTAYVAVALFALLSFAFPSSTPIRRGMPLFVALALVAGLADRLYVAEHWVLRDAGSVSTLSDRLPLWEFMTRIMLRDSPVVGLGYYAASRVLGPLYNPFLGTGHSVFVEVLVGAGLLGIGALLVLYIGLGRYAARLVVHGRRHPLAFGVVGLFVLVFVISLTSTDGIQAGPTGFTFWSLTALLPAVWREIRGRQRALPVEPRRPLSAEHSVVLRS